MVKLEEIENGKKILYADNFFSGDYNQELYLKKANDDGSHKPKFYITVHSNINGKLVNQGYIYFYLDPKTKTSNFIGVKVNEEFRGLNIGSFLIASWIDLCLNNGYNFLGVHETQRKPFLLFLLKTYGFEIWDITLYHTRPDVISICKSFDASDRRKFLLFRDPKHEKAFAGTNICKTDNYEIVHDPRSVIILDNVLLPLQGRKTTSARYELLYQELANEKVETVLNRHKK